MNNKIPPQNIDAESDILGCCLLDPNAIGRIAEILMPEAFYVSAYQEIYKVILELYHQDKPTDLVTVTSWLSDQKLLSKVGGKNQLAKLIETVSAVNIDHLANLVLDKYQRRQLIKTGNEIVELGYDTTQEILEVLEQSEKKIFNLTANKKDKFQPKLINHVPFCPPTPAIA